MEYINFGGDFGEVPVKFSIPAMKEIERRGNTLPEGILPVFSPAPGRPKGGPLRCVDLINSMNNIAVLCLVVEAIVRVEQPKIGAVVVEKMIDSYIEDVADLPQLINTIVPMYDRGLAPRGMAERAKKEKKEEKKEKVPSSSGKKLMK